MPTYTNERKCKFPGCESVYRPSAELRAYCSATHEVECLECGRSFSTASGPPGRRKSSCKKCVYEKANEKRKETLLELYGVENQFQREEVKAKAQEQWEKSYGGHPMKNSEVKAKVKATNEERYGGSAPVHSDEVKEKIRKTNRERRGVDWTIQDPSVIEKRKKTNLERYGSESPLGSDEIQEKIRRTNTERHGVENPFQREDVKARIRENYELKYGVSFPLQVERFRANAIATNREKFGTDWPLGNEAVSEKARATMKKRYGSEHALLIPEFREKAAASYAETVKNGTGKSSRVSKVNREWGNFISDEFDVPHGFERPFGDFSADLGFADDKILVDINPSVTHNSARSFGCILNRCVQPCDRHRPTERSYHLARAQAAKRAGVKLIQIYDWDSKDAVIRLLAGHLESGWKRHSARKLSLRSILQREANLFLKLNHIQGALRNQQVCLGLFNGDELLAVATFGGARFKSAHEWEFLRYAVKRGHIIHGGAERLWSRFVELKAPKSVISYIDFNHSTSERNFLLKLGYLEHAAQAPVLYWSKGSDAIRETTLLTLGADRLLKTSYGPKETSGLDNHSIMALEGWLPIYTAGNRNFIWRR